MSKGMKRFWIVIGCIFATGVILTAVGFALGASGGVWFDRTGIHYGTQDANPIHLADDNTDRFDSIDIKLVSTDVEFVTAKTFGYDFTYNGATEPTVKVVNNTLQVIEPDDPFVFQVLGFWRGFDYSSKLIVYVPEGTALDYVTMATASGKTVLDGSKITINNVTCVSASGDIHLSNLDLSNLILDVASGDVKLDKVLASNATIDMASGRLNYKESVVNNLSIDMASGDIVFDGEIIDGLQLRMMSGDADFKLKGSEEDFVFSHSIMSGDMRVNGRSINSVPWLSQGTTDRPGAHAYIDVDLTSGSVNIDFRS